MSETWYLLVAGDRLGPYPDRLLITDRAAADIRAERLNREAEDTSVLANWRVCEVRRIEVEP